MHFRQDFAKYRTQGYEGNIILKMKIIRKLILFIFAVFYVLFNQILFY